ncbi:uncharacterized protein MKK02DRAFT_43647 [Dioszegia hungarica]|uniref:SPX domain-containing protein n=1 Tax=Dioszegia hungarica TaxID=4972 RepID=A0AA38HEY4_9TREE|nr:uncharacterized protein MKK02DRAFT_43647 [Dioszegia hungarica]KAI9637719.1 hypothetical protein MKK02DRAFT_43647 [Dioszegia hungarica]
MKFGKEFQQILSDSHFPEEWRSSAIEYGQLKKIIKDVVSELSGMGLSPDVLNKLLVTEEARVTPAHSPQGRAEVSSAFQSTTPPAVEGDILEFEFDSDEASPPSLYPTPMSAPRQPKQTLVDPMLDTSGYSDLHPPATSRSMEAGPSSLHPSHNQRKFRVRLLSESRPETPAASRDPSPGGEARARPMSVSGMFKDTGAGELGDGDQLSGSWGRESVLDGAGGVRGRKVIRRSMNEGTRVKAEYVLGGDAQHPQPQLVLHLPAATPPLSRDTSSTPSMSNGVSSEDDTEDEDETLSRVAVPIRKSTLLLQSAANSPNTIRAARSPLEPPEIDIVPPSPSLQRVRTALSPIFALASGAIDNDLGDLSLGDSAIEDEPLELPTPPPLGRPGPSPPNGERDRDIIIPLASDQAFFNLLTAALTSLSAFHAEQQEQFRLSVSRLCSMVSTSIQPSSSSSGSGASISPLTSNGTRPFGVAPSLARPNKKDLYAWREIFTLWIEAEIFESSAERTRGERTVEQAEVRLQKFADEVIKRGLGDRRTLRGKKARGAWEEFLRLNVLLLDLKRFQMANINAARKILKKHDKRTALTASTGFQSFVRSTLSAVGTDGNITTWTFYNTSLPHVLLASLTDTLLPILPSLDDYACLICTSIAFKPIRLSCKHLFCVRCLVKMQRAGKAECPLCRSRVVLLADKDSLDVQVMSYMKEWFPKEVKMKQKENDEEINRELMSYTQGGAGGGSGGKECVIM